MFDNLFTILIFNRSNIRSLSYTFRWWYGYPTFSDGFTSLSTFSDEVGEATAAVLFSPGVNDGSIPFSANISFNLATSALACINANVASSLTTFLSINFLLISLEALSISELSVSNLSTKSSVFNFPLTDSSLFNFSINNSLAAGPLQHLLVV